MKRIILVLIFLSLMGGCAMVSEDIHPELTYREEPNIEISYFHNWFLLEWVCLKQNHYIPHIYLGCVLVPIDPNGICFINIMESDKFGLEHEKQHCKGFADTMLPWKMKQ